ncbi:MAG: hypothetical protein LKF36_11160 [Lactobacillus sp.]|jgi:hypothetical protein|nr:hypothetical protein [Lactobacillus sp.]
MSNSIIVYNQPKQKFLNFDLDNQALAQADLSSIDLSTDTDLSHLVNSETFALVFDGTNWDSQTYMQWEDLRINEALQSVRHQFTQPTQDILSQFVAGMDIKYQGNKSWTALLEDLGQEIEEAIK